MATRLLAAFLCVAVGVCATNPLAGMPDVLFVLSDDLGFGEVGFTQGSSRVNTNLTTPNVDALAASGVVFTDAYVGAPVCAPSRCALMTGRHSGHGTIRGNRDVDGHDYPLSANDTTFFASFAAAGYHVSCVGKWGVGWVNNSGSPILHGCTDYFGEFVRIIVRRVGCIKFIK